MDGRRTRGCAAAMAADVAIHKWCICCDAAIEAFAWSDAFRSLTVAALIRWEQCGKLH